MIFYFFSDKDAGKTLGRAEVKFPFQILEELDRTAIGKTAEYLYTSSSKFK